MQETKPKDAKTNDRKPEKLRGSKGGRFLGGGTAKCEVCNLPAQVKSTKKTEMPDGRTLVTRQMKCTGRHGHTYPLKEIVGKKLLGK